MSFFGLGKPDVENLEKKGDVHRLIKALGYQKSYYVRMAAATALGRIGDARAVEPLCTVLKDSDRDVRGDAVEALGRISDARAVEPLCIALGDSDTDVRWSAANTLALWYRTGKLDSRQKSRILASKDKIIQPHHDVTGGSSSDCSWHQDRARIDLDP